MSTLRGIFPEPKKEQKKNFIRENVKQLKLIQDKSKEPRFPTMARVAPAGAGAAAAAAGARRPSAAGPGGPGALAAVHSSLSNKSKPSADFPAAGTATANKKPPDVKIKKGDMAEFLERKEKLRQLKPKESPEENIRSPESTSCLKEIGCQTVETNFSKKLDETKITMLYTKKSDEAKMKASGDSERLNSPTTPISELADYERPRSRLNAILERKDQNKDPYLPSGYQKGVLPKYLRERKESGTKETEGAKADDESAVCPPGHVTLPDQERKETLRMLRNSFAELVSELNKMPVKTDTLRMRNRKMELEKQLAKLEEGIKVFSRPKVFVKIGE